jgi:general secretion pathway protein G
MKNSNKAFTLIRTIRKNLVSVNGFTLIELLVVISIIGILMGLSIFGLQGAREASRDATRKAALEQIRSGLEIYKADCGGYPLTAQMSGSSLAGAAGIPGCTGNTYISSIPVDPVPSTHTYAYTSTDGVTYTLCAALEQAPSPTMAPAPACGNCATLCNYRVIQP